MKLIKDGQVIILENENHAQAFINSGWKEYNGEAVEQAASPKTEVPKRTPARKKVSE